VIGRKAYRAPGRAIVPGWAFVVMFFLVGVVTAVGSPGNPGKGGTIGDHKRVSERRLHQKAHGGG
jgi:hypothetical protein